MVDSMTTGYAIRTVAISRCPVYGRTMCRVFFLSLFCVLLPLHAALAQGTLDDPIVDSHMTFSQAVLENQPPGTPADIQRRQELVTVRYYGYDGKIHQGQIVVDRALAADVRQAFQAALEQKFPVESVLPVAHPKNLAKAPYGLTPDTNNTSGFVYRPMVNGKNLSYHARGWALDINPRQNPYIKGDTVLPPGATYDPDRQGTLYASHPLVKTLKAMGWNWGGDWTSHKDYMHFQKKPAGADM